MEINKTIKRGKYKQYFYNKNIKIPRTTLFSKKGKKKQINLNSEILNYAIDCSQVIFSNLFSKLIYQYSISNNFSQQILKTRQIIQLIII